MSTSRAVLLFTGVLTAIRLTLIGTSDLAGDEAHYWMWSQRLAPAYFSKGPGVAFAIRASTMLFGATEFGVRFWSPLLAAATSWILYSFARRVFSAQTGFWTVIAFNVLPIVTLGSFVMTIDPLSIFFWSAAMFSFWLALERSPAFSWHWPLTGLLIGLGFLCKYTNAMQLISIALVLWLAPRHQREFKRPRFYLLLAVFVLCTIPPIVWNHHHAWITLLHLRSRGSLEGNFGFRPGEILSFVAAHFVTFSPLLFLGLAWAVIANWRRVRQQFRTLFLFWFGAPVFLFYLLLSVNKAAAPNWDALAFLSLGVLAVSFWREQAASRPALRVWAGAALLVSLAISAATIIAITGTTLRKTERIHGWRTATAALETVRAQIETQLGERVFLIADERDRASEFAFYLRDKTPAQPGHPPVYIVESQDMRNQFSFWLRYDEFVARPPGEPATEGGDVYTEEGVNLFAGRSALYIQSGPGKELPRNITAAFTAVEPRATIEVRRRGARVRTLDVFLCRGYKTLPL